MPAALALLLAVYALLLAGGALARVAGRAPAVLLAFAAATALVWRARRRPGAPRLRAAPAGRNALAALLGLGAGFASFPAWVALIGGVGSGLGLEPPAAQSPPGRGALVWAAAIVLAPLFEEALYRECLLGALRGVAGAVPALVLSSLAFAVPHGESWTMLATFLVGLALGAVALLGGSLALCAALHAGLNLAALAHEHGAGWALPAVGLSACSGWLALGAALGVLRLPRRARLGRAGRIRVASAGLVALVLVAFRVLLPEPGARGPALYLAVISLGYGHLAGAALFARRRLARWLPAGVPPSLLAGCVATSLLTLFALYAAALRARPALALPLLALAAWHAVENDLGLGRARPDGGGIGPVPRSAGHHLRAAGLTAALVGLLAASAPPDAEGALRGAGLGLPAWAVAFRPDASSWLRFEEVFAAWTLYHVVSWLLFSWDRARERGARRRLLAIHAAPLLICGSALATPVGWEHPLRVLLFAPGVYLFWSSLHVVQTLGVRGLESRSPGSCPGSVL